MSKIEKSFIVDIDFETIKLPPVTDILVLGKKLPQGKIGVFHSFHMISPDVFELIEIDDDKNVEAIIINKNILAKIAKGQILDILREYVFPYITKGESVRVNFNIQISYRNIRGEINEGDKLPIS